MSIYQELTEYQQYVKDFSEHAEKQIKETIEQGGFVYKVKPFFNLVVTDSLFDHYMYLIDENVRPQYQCNECRKFVNRFGSLIVFNDKEERVVVGWTLPEEKIPACFKESHRAIIKMLMTAPIHSPFMFKTDILGSIEKGGYDHLHICVPEVAKEQYVFCSAQNQFKNAGAVHDEFGVFCKKIAAIKEDAIVRVAGLINHEMVNKSESFKYEVMLLGSVRAVLLSNENKLIKTDAVWKVFIENYGFLNGFRNTVIGKMIKLIEEEVPEQEIIAQFNSMVAPEKYMRPETGPNKELIDQAEQIIKELNLEKSFERRSATLSDLEPFIFWQPATKPEEKKKEGFFSKLREETVAASSAAFPVVVKMGYKQFKEEVLPNAVRIEYHTVSVDAYHNLITAVHDDAEPILVYDKVDKRNPLSLLTYTSNEFLSTRNWNIKINDLVPVVAILPVVTEPKIEGFQADFLVLENCRDLQRYPGIGLFPEFLRRELYPVRKVIEAYSNSVSLPEPRDEAVGGLVIGYKNQTMNCTFTVTFNDGFVKTIVVDRSV